MQLNDLKVQVKEEMILIRRVEVTPEGEWNESCYVTKNIFE